MKAAILSGRATVELRELPRPVIGAGEVLVRMRSCGVCGTDIEKFHGDYVRQPVLGHEVAGEVEEVGSHVQIVRKHDRIIVHHHISCKNCFYCKNGLETLCEAYPSSNLDPCGFAEYFRVPEALVKGETIYKLPPSMSFEQGSMVEPTACCIRALMKIGIKSGNGVAVFGVGPAGLTFVQLLRLYGASPIFAIDLLESRRQMALKIGADQTFDPTNEDVPASVLERTEGIGTDCAIVATGSPKAISEAISSVRKGGKILLYAFPPRAPVPIDLYRMFLTEISIQASYSTSETEMQMALDLIAREQIHPSQLITHRLPLERIEEALHLAESGKEAVKIIVEN